MRSQYSCALSANEPGFKCCVCWFLYSRRRVCRSSSAERIATTRKLLFGLMKSLAHVIHVATIRYNFIAQYMRFLCFDLLRMCLCFILWYNCSCALTHTLWRIEISHIITDCCFGEVSTAVPGPLLFTKYLRQLEKSTICIIS